MASSVEKYHFIAFYRRYSSWGARVSILLNYYQIPHDASIVSIEEARKLAPGAPHFPTLISPSLPPSTHITDSLAIAEYLAESHPDLPLWPEDIYLRALARSAAAQMHSGFPALRNAFCANFTARYSGPVPVPVSAEARAEIERVLGLWGDARRATVRRLRELGKEEEDEGFLFGRFGIADAFFWPVLWRFRSYDLPLNTASPEAIAWMKTMWNDPRIKEEGRRYYREAERPETRLPWYEDVFADTVPEIEYGQFTEDWVFEG